MIITRTHLNANFKLESVWHEIDDSDYIENITTLSNSDRDAIALLFELNNSPILVAVNLILSLSGTILWPNGINWDLSKELYTLSEMLVRLS